MWAAELARERIQVGAEVATTCETDELMKEVQSRVTRNDLLSPEAAKSIVDHYRRESREINREFSKPGSWIRNDFFRLFKWKVG
jgi:hypothetical protein